MEEGNEVDNIEFSWGKKRGIGGKTKRVQFYESFTYDGEEYLLLDSVYVYKEGAEPYIGKLIKIWEHPDKTKRVKVLWFFRPGEIISHLQGESVADNELFLASGEGPGVANVNPLEAIAGKCNVVCTSKDSRNRQPSDEELQSADFIFYRTFDVGKCKLSDKIDEKIAGLDVKMLLNRADPQMASANIDKNDGGSTVAIGVTADEVAKQSKASSAAPNEQKSPQGENSSDVGVIFYETKFDGREENFSGDKHTMRGIVDSKRDDEKVVNTLVPEDIGALDDRPSKQVKLDGSAETCEGPL